MLKLDEPFRYQEIFIISLCQIVEIWGLRVKNCFCSFQLIFCPFNLNPWIHIYLRIWIQRAKILRILWNRITRTVIIKAILSIQDIRNMKQRLRLILKLLPLMMRKLQIWVNLILAKLAENVPLPPFTCRDDLFKTTSFSK